MSYIDEDMCMEQVSHTLCNASSMIRKSLFEKEKEM